MLAVCLGLRFVLPKVALAFNMACKAAGKRKDNSDSMPATKDDGAITERDKLINSNLIFT